ncbi:MAG: hypothetical protein ABIC40_03865, partial [bacterium]
MLRGRLIQLTLFTAFSVLIGCSHGGGNGVIAPETILKTSLESTSQHVLWGMWSCALDTASGTMEIVPLRGPMFTANVNNLLEAKPGNLLIQDLDLTQLFDNGLVECTVTLRHPFPGLDMYHGFDVWGVFMHNGESTIEYDSLSYPGGPSAGENEAVLLNADGYTRWFNYTEFSGSGFPIVKFMPGKLGKLNDQSAILNGYRIFADNLGKDDDYYDWISDEANFENRGIFQAGQTNSRHYEMKFPLIGGVPKVDFQYAVIVSWEPGDPSLTGDEYQYDPFDFPASANCDEAFFVHSDTSASTLYNDGAGSSGGLFRTGMEIFDWQGGIVSNFGVPNEIKRVLVEGNFVPGGSYELDQGTLSVLASPGTAVSSVFQVEIGGCSPDPVESEEYWIIVESGGSAGESYYQGFPSPYPADAVRAAFYRGSVAVSDQSPIGVTVTSIDPDSVPFWGSVDDAEISGTNFENGCTVELRKDAEVVTATDVVWLNGESLTCDFDLTGADSGLWDVAVINPGLEEGVLEDGFTIEVWSEEQTLETGGDRLPQLAETSEGSAVLLVGCDDNNMRYLSFEEGVGWGSVD